MKNKTPHTITGIRKRLIESCSSLFFIYKAISEYRSIQAAMDVLKKLTRLKRDVQGNLPVSKMVKANGRYYWNLHVPGFPSKALTANVVGDMNRIHPVRSGNNRLNMLFLGITKKCPLQCQHCYEWDALNKKETLTLSSLKSIVDKFQRSGVGHIHLLGGEPMARFEEMVELIRDIKPDTEVWMSTCGFNLTEGKAIILKEAGLTGVAISLDHFEPGPHNEFRGNPRAFDWALAATTNCRKAGLITCWSLCTTREFISHDNLYQYALAAKRNKVNYIQLFEPMPTGRYSGKDVALTPSQIKILEDFHREMNTSRNYRDFPLVEYIGQYQRRIGCLGSGNRYLFIDPDGNVQSCPFCRTSRKMHAEDQDVDDLIDWIGKEGCQRYKMHASSNYLA